ncbi:MAG TPA: PQQ-binding-like beta-propeller repeat protein [Fimbriiglobus sp.]|jgi:outer membrane protein assembly factor BamB
MRCLAFLLLTASPLLAADDWNQFRGPTGDGIAPASSKPPVKWSEKENVRWKTAIHDKGWSSPVVWGDKVWVTTAQEKGKSFYVLGLDVNTGKVLHDLHLFDVNPLDTNDPKDVSQYNSYASPTPVVEAGRLYAHFGSHGTVCLDTNTGEKIWERRDLLCNHFRGPASSPIVYKDWLYLTFDGFDPQYIVCLNKKTGETVWRKDRTLPYKNSGNPKTDNDYKKAYATPSVFEIDGKPQLVSSAAMGTIAYDPATGDEIWRVITDGMNEACRPILAHGLIYLTAGSKSSLFAVKAGMTGDITQTGVAWKFVRSAPTKSSPVVVGDLLFFVNDTGVPCCLDAKTGKKYWQEGSFGGKFAASPVYADGRIYFAGESGKTYVIAAGRQYEPLAKNVLDSGCLASPAVVGNALLLRTHTHLYRIEAGK